MGCDSSTQIQSYPNVSQKSFNKQSSPLNKQLKINSNNHSINALDENKLSQTLKQKTKFFKLKNIGQGYFYFTDIVLGQGSYGKVYSGGRKIGDQFQQEEYAVKQIYFTNKNNAKKEIKKEFDIMYKINHKNIIKSYAFLQMQDCCYIIIEKCDSDLRHLLRAQARLNKKLSQNECFYIISSICEGFRELNQKKIIHRDLKPQNVMLKKGIIKIGDFGVSKYSSQSQSNRTYAGTPIYMPLQVLKNQRYTTKYDVWTMGCIFYKLLQGELPWQMIGDDKVRINLFEMYFKEQNITQIKQIQIKTTKLSPQAINFLNKCLRIDAQKRFDWKQLLDEFSKRNSYYLRDQKQYSSGLVQILQQSDDFYNEEQNNNETSYQINSLKQVKNSKILLQDIEIKIQQSNMLDKKQQKSLQADNMNFIKKDQNKPIYMNNSKNQIKNDQTNDIKEKYLNYQKNFQRLKDESETLKFKVNQMLDKLKELVKETSYIAKTAKNIIKSIKIVHINELKVIQNPSSRIIITCKVVLKLLKQKISIDDSDEKIWQNMKLFLQNPNEFLQQLLNMTSKVNIQQSVIQILRKIIKDPSNQFSQKNIIDESYAAGKFCSWSLNILKFIQYSSKTSCLEITKKNILAEYQKNAQQQQSLSKQIHQFRILYQNETNQIKNKIIEQIKFYNQSLSKLRLDREKSNKYKKLYTYLDQQIIQNQQKIIKLTDIVNFLQNCGKNENNQILFKQNLMNQKSEKSNKNLIKFNKQVEISKKRLFGRSEEEILKRDTFAVYNLKRFKPTLNF